jgi:hypothetical protein
MEIQELQGEDRNGQPIQSIWTEFEIEPGGEDTWYNVNFFKPSQWHYFGNLKHRPDTFQRGKCEVWVLSIYFSLESEFVENIIDKFAFEFDGIVQRNLTCNFLTAFGRFDDLIPIAHYLRFLWNEFEKINKQCPFEIRVWAPFKVKDRIKIFFPFPYLEETVDWSKYVATFTQIRNIWFKNHPNGNLGRFFMNYPYTNEELVIHLTLNGIIQYIKQCEKEGYNLLEHQTR